jgi:hypothetical protein
MLKHEENNFELNMIELNLDGKKLILNVTNLLLTNMYRKQDSMNELFDLIILFLEKKLIISFFELFININSPELFLFFSFDCSIYLSSKIVVTKNII